MLGALVAEPKVRSASLAQPADPLFLSGVIVVQSGQPSSALRWAAARRFHRGVAFTFPAAETEGSDGIRILGHTADAPPCPVCNMPLAQAVIDNVHPVHFCGKCRGLLLSRPIFAGVVNTRRAWATDLPAHPVPLDSRALERRLSCPRCSMRFETYAHYGPGNVVIDNCTRCDQVWLDFGEIRQIVAAPGRDRGSRQITPIDDDYVRGGPGEDLDVSNFRHTEGEARVRGAGGP